MAKLVIKKCVKCGAIIEEIKPCTCDNCGIKCCGENMLEMRPNSVDAAFEKHVPTYEVIENQIIVRVNHVMEDDHYIEWVALVGDGRVGKKFFVPNTKAEVMFPYIKGSTIYAYCNKHGLWNAEVK